VNNTKEYTLIRRKEKTMLSLSLSLSLSLLKVIIIDNNKGTSDEPVFIRKTNHNG
jgi:hypothetical protein